MNLWLKLAMLTLAIAFIAPAQSSSVQSLPEKPEVVQGDANSCELNSAMFNVVAHDMVGNYERLFVIARLGEAEVSRDLNRRRLHNVRTAFKQGLITDESRFVFAEGERVEGEGRVEFYLGSKLKLTSLVRRNRDICVTCCDFDDSRYYGFGKSDKPKRRRK